MKIYYVVNGKKKSEIKHLSYIRSIFLYIFNNAFSESRKRKSENLNTSNNADDQPPGDSVEPPAKKKPADDSLLSLTTRTGGAYIPPARLRAMQAKITDKTRYIGC